MASEIDAGQDSVILAGFENRRAAEHMVTALGRGFRKRHRKGHATAVVVSRNKDGSLKLTQSRVLSASGVVYTGMRVTASVAVGFTGIFSSLKGGRGAVRDVRERGSHVGSDEQRAHEILDQFGPNAALLLVACDDEDTRQAVLAKRPTVRVIAGMARAPGSWLPSIPVASTTGYAALSASPRAPAARPLLRAEVGGAYSRPNWRRIETLSE
jgi:uncharacterized membrane protein